MSHILIFGQTPNIVEFKARLNGWGMSTGNLKPGPADPGPVSVDDCDAVILDFRGGVHPLWLTKFLETHEHSAPVLILAPDEGSGLDSNSNWAELAGDDSVETRLLLSLQDAIAHSRQRRGVEAGPPGGSLLHFLGHEFRSPLTAAKTALEALQGELSSDSIAGRQEDQTAVEASLKMADIALRNIQRLHQTVEWSQDLLVHMGTLDAEDESLESSIQL